MSSNVDPLVVGRVIGEVVDLFVPMTEMEVNFGAKHVNNGCDIKPSMAADPPSIHIGGRPSHLFTLVMTDPDAPSPSEPSLRECLHWLVVNIPGGTDPTQADTKIVVLHRYGSVWIGVGRRKEEKKWKEVSGSEEVMPYMRPKPPLGIHRYVLVLFQQKVRVPIASIELSPETVETRAHFNTRDFADRHDLGMPVAAVYFNSQKEPMNRRRH
ncbi:hypothetical protein LUZ62_045507 [Rhynchospora pubera]|uniref:Uncharacterized protein n=1 Tax=Rhynchospora pubera TaxID=906938 RepID=A0AAV8FTR8_9POAL|nr:hypothetical protein LUZ62_045507 [Rhynchospora pubera]